jgi:hypothetical protein
VSERQNENLKEKHTQLIARDRLDRVRECLVRIEILIEDSERYPSYRFREAMKMPCLRFHVSVRNLRHAIADLYAAKEGR